MVIDSNILIEHLRTKDKLSTKFYKLLQGNEKLFISAVSVYEIYCGAATKDKEKNIKLLIKDITILPFDFEASLKAAEIFRQLKAKNQLIEFRDIFIAATCIIENLPISTLNRKHFERIEGLKIA
ncbi:type II toxin-antitoxin system VapC family toxin [uncultured Mucilaginibacter sp.]|uniref:type II toxin-antitoxin system VapC family toxin n=1 Tax=uncultured Mucilaginibacter sp. TaxID=797541 RepID=UPI0026117C4A|nr:type II toxin-antitoxin system VapC family toxin [uncultured Mucilaginibacter sp.]